MRAAFAAVWLLFNLVVFALYGADKRRARKGLWRIPERKLLLGMWLGGGLGALLGMRLFRHKTRHRAFALSAPPAALLSAALAVALLALRTPLAAALCAVPAAGLVCVSV